MKRLVSAATAAMTISLAVVASAAAGDANGLHNRFAHADVRESPAAQLVLAQRAAALSATPSAAADALKSSLDAEGIVSLDPLTKTVRFAGSTSSFLTGKSSAPASSIASSYVAAHAAAFGLDSSGLAALHLRTDYVSIDGTHHLSYVQEINGLHVFGNGVKVNVAKDGRIINVVGSPIASASGAPAVSPGITAAQAVATSRAGVQEAVLPLSAKMGTDTAQTTVFANGDRANLVYFAGLDGLTLAWQTLIWGRNDAWQTVVDAATGKLLYRQTISSDANGSVWTNYPGASVGGTQQTVDLSKWLNAGASTLVGPNVHVYSDVNDDNSAESTEEVGPSDASGNFVYPFTSFDNTTNSPCDAAFPCSWDSTLIPGAGLDASFNVVGPPSWDTNRKQNAVQVFFFTNNFHDHLAASPIGFTDAAGAFDGNDALNAEPDDGADSIATIDGIPFVHMPDPNHTDNANMSTPPDGISPRMQMYLFNDPVSDDPEFGGTPGADPFGQTNGGDEADVVYHEFTHGLSNRLVVDADGNSTLGGIQAGAMGEAWSDWYAMDYLVNTGQLTDTPAVGELRVGNYVGRGEDLIRTQPMDCPVGSTASVCPGGTSGHKGGYTYGDYGHIIPQGVEVHADGEIWGETLWDLRTALGSAVTENLVTRAMELSPSNPSMLDERNAILQADLVDNGGANHDTIWSVFAHRGMGFFAGAINGDDSKPVQDFQLPPTSKKFGKLTGTITDDATGQPLANAPIVFGGHASGFSDDIVGQADGKGRYDLKKILAGTYPDAWVAFPGYDRAVKTVTINSNANQLDWQLKRDWASLGGGASIVSFTGPDFAPACPPEGAIDQTDGIGWGSTTDGNDGVATGNVTPKVLIFQLPTAVTINGISINPNHSCGDPGSSSMRGFLVEVSTDGSTWSQASTGVMYAGNRDKLNPLTLGGNLTGIKFIRLTMLNPQVPNATGAACTGPADCGTDPNDDSGVAAHCGPGKDNAFGGCQFMDMTEIEVYGRPS
jgi:extracellular elastinolytic metalloproteinase